MTEEYEREPEELRLFLCRHFEEEWQDIKLKVVVFGIATITTHLL